MTQKELERSRIYRVYRITCLSNGLQYVGQTCNTLNRRFNKHLRDAERFKSFCPLSGAIREHGRENFTVSLVCEGLNKEEANHQETSLIQQGNLTDRRFGYNVQKGGSGFGRRKKREVELEQLAKLYQGGLSTTEIGEQTGLDNSTVGYWLERMGVVRRPAAPKKKTVPIEEVVTLYRSGMSTNRISKKFRVSSTTIAQRLVEANEPLRKGKKKTNISPEEMWVLYQKGKTLAQIGEIAGVSALTVTKWIREAGGQPKTPGSWAIREDLDDSQIKELYLSGRNSRQIAEELGCGEITIHTRLKNLGVKMRPRGTRPPKTVV